MLAYYRSILRQCSECDFQCNTHKQGLFVRTTFGTACIKHKDGKRTLPSEHLKPREAHARQQPNLSTEQLEQKDVRSQFSSELAVALDVGPANQAGYDPWRSWDINSHRLRRYSPWRARYDGEEVGDQSTVPGGTAGPGGSTFMTQRSQHDIINVEEVAMSSSRIGSKTVAIASKFQRWQRS